MINIFILAKLILNVSIRYYSIPNFIISDQNAVFSLKFGSLLYYFFYIKYLISTTFYLKNNI